MEKEDLNVTYIILGGHVELQKYRYLYFMTFFIVYILILCSNSTIVYLIWKHQDLHEPMYIFHCSFKQIISYKACVVQFFMFYTLGCSEFLLLAAMAYDRYVSICKPLHYPTIMRKRTVCTFLLCSFTLKVIFCNNTIYKLFCVSSRVLSIFGAFYLLNVGVFPVFFIIFTYTRILIICYHGSKEVRKKAAQTCLPHLLVLSNYFFLITYDVITVRLESDFPTIARLIMTSQLVLYNPLFNPIIYGLKMKEISKHLKKLFCQETMR
uniref:G-protein coupled receptors family 1 profile domain-containing protein n=1 Tax=Anabas testudineus TaxID=64144 RepID=A0A3Q1IK79_ANATE